MHVNLVRSTVLDNVVLREERVQLDLVDDRDNCGGGAREQLVNVANAII